MIDDMRLSKTLSLWLRHKPEAAGFTLDARGWADVDLVLAALTRAGQPCEWSQLLELVANSDKQRFELSADTARIRARQGHSVEVALEWPVTAPPLLLYHGTVTRFLDSILAEGLRPMRRHHVHLSPDVDTARRVGQRRGVPTLLLIRAADLARTGQTFLLASNGVWLTDHVPPKYLLRVAD